MSEGPDPRFGRVVDPGRYLGPLRERFGFPEQSFANLLLLRHSKDYLAIAPVSLRGPDPAPSGGCEGVGLLFLRTAMAVPKLTTPAAMAFGGQATRHAVELDRERAERYLRRETIELREADLACCTSPGALIVRHGGAALGMGFFRLHEGQTTLESQFPRAWALSSQKG